MNTLNKLSFCSPYTEVQHFESSSAYHQVVDLNGLQEDSFLHYLADNVDHIIDTLDGLNTFHGMGIIVSVTPRNTASKPIPITKCTVSSEEIVKAAQIEVKFISRKRDVATLSKFEILPELMTIDNPKVLSNLWKFAWLVQPIKPLEWIYEIYRMICILGNLLFISCQ